MTVVQERSAARAGVAAAPVARGRMVRGDAIFAALMVLPTLIAVLAITAYPFFYSAWLSLNRLNLFTKRWNFVGLSNYTDVWNSGELRDALSRTILFCLVA